MPLAGRAGVLPYTGSSLVDPGSTRARGSSIVGQPDTPAAPPPTGTRYRGFDGFSPPTDAQADSTTYSLGVEFAVTSPVTLTEIRFFQPSTNAPSSATRQGALYVAGTGGALLVPFAPFPATVPGWNTLTLATPYQLTPGNRYIAVVFHPGGRYAATTKFFDVGQPGGSNLVNGPLQIISHQNASLPGQGSYLLSNTPGKPDNTFNQANYWTDVTVEEPFVAPPYAAGQFLPFFG